MKVLLGYACLLGAALLTAGLINAHETGTSCNVVAVEMDCGDGVERIETGNVLTPSANEPGPVNPDLQVHLQGSATLGWMEGQVGQPAEFWNQRVDFLPVSKDSAGTIKYLAQAELCFNGDPADCTDSLQTLGGAVPSRQQSLNWRLDRGRAYHPDGTDWEGYGQNVHTLTAPQTGQPFALIDGADAQILGEDSWFAGHCDRALMPIVPMASPRFPALAPRVRVQENPNRQCGPDMGDISSDPLADCHYNVVSMVDGTIWEQWRARGVGLAPGIDLTGALGYSAGCTAVFDLSTPQDAEMRGWSTTSANVAGVPYTPFLVTPGEIEAGEIKHAIAIAIYNHWLSPGAYVRAEGAVNKIAGGGTHASQSTVTDQYWQGQMPGWTPDMVQPATGSRFRLRSDFVINPSWPKGVRVLYTALQRYGGYVIDGTFGGTFVALSNDAFDAHSWTEVNIDSSGVGVNFHPLSLELYGTLGWQDFELVSEYGAQISHMPGFGLPNERPTQRSVRYPELVEF